jgi:tetratricopeptide (TPR) repeat protein
MSERFQTKNRELDDLFERYRAAPRGYVFAPLADACRKAGMIEEALDICARGVGQHPRYPSGYVVQGKCLYDAGRAGDAQAAFDRVLDLDPKNLVALKYLGIIHAERGDSARAREYFEHILALDPDDRDIRAWMEDVAHRPAVSRSTKVAEPGPAPAGGAAVVAPRTGEATVSAPAARPEPTDVVSDLLEEAAEVLDDEDPSLLPDVADEEFTGAPITLRDESVISDEIATITLADIYASQGYATRALRIYRDVIRRQPDNAELAARIEKLERQEAETPAAAPAPVPVAEPAPRPAPPATAPDLPASSLPAESASGQPIDQTRNYEQFKRWLKATHR